MHLQLEMNFFMWSRKALNKNEDYPGNTKKEDEIQTYVRGKCFSRWKSQEIASVWVDEWGEQKTTKIE